MTLFAIQGREEQDPIFASWEDCETWMLAQAMNRLPRSTIFYYVELQRQPDGTQLPVTEWQRFEHKGAKVRPPTAEEAHQDELDRIAYYRSMDMHSSSPVSGAVWMPPTRYEGYP